MGNVVVVQAMFFTRLAFDLEVKAVVATVWTNFSPYIPIG